MSLRHGLLGLLNYGSMTGYELNKAFKASLNFFWQAKPSQIYRELDAMEQSGWLSSERVIQDERPNKRIYSITNSGKEEFLTWLAAPEPGAADIMRVRSAFLMRIFFAGETSDRQALSMLRAYRETCAETIAAFGAVSGTIDEYRASVVGDRKPKYWKIAALYGEGFYRAGLAWAEEAIQLLEGEQHERSCD